MLVLRRAYLGLQVLRTLVSRSFKDKCTMASSPPAFLVVGPFATEELVPFARQVRAITLRILAA